MLLDSRAAVPPLGLSERTFADLLVWCHEYHRSASGVLLSRQEPNCAAGTGGAAGQSTLPPASVPHDSNDPGNTSRGRLTSTPSSTAQRGSAADISGHNDTPAHQGNGAAPHGGSDPSNTGRERPISTSSSTALSGSAADISGANGVPIHQGNGAAPHGSGDRGDTGRERPSSTSSSTAQPGSATDTSETNNAPTAHGNGATPSLSGGHDSQSASPGSGSRSGTPASPTDGDGATILRETVPPAIPAPAATSTNPSTSSSSVTPTTSQAATATNSCPPGNILAVSDTVDGDIAGLTICVAV
ncbi:hypothetical protein PAXRUDRAFT_829599 [Paxillus rubicundulus Ve08.2h10]|uniref:Uncharacterized protein n=1 Tax=Paxillus rubicundulus Ve08.2h10 TaxID=930991 RepID=A0A0D0E5P1_9AGAM|nr:hypothetical protein PAXRUDRAFT_829599 [Paxillus rubicundulus Ve08.2h10]